MELFEQKAVSSESKQLVNCHSPIILPLMVASSFKTENLPLVRVAITATIRVASTSLPLELMATVANSPCSWPLRLNPPPIGPCPSDR